MTTPHSEPRSCPHDDTWFDRTLCIAGNMHTVCNHCGHIIDGPCECEEVATAQSSPWLTPQECADHMKVSLRTLQDWRSRKVGPPFHKVGKTVRYHIEEVDEWLLKS